MRLSKKAIKEFKEIYYQEFGEKITTEEAHEKFSRLINLLRPILKVPSKKDQYQNSKNTGPVLFD